MRVRIEAILHGESHTDISRVIVDINRIIKEFNINSTVIIELQHEDSAQSKRGCIAQDRYTDQPESVQVVSAESGRNIPGDDPDKPMDPGADDSG